MLITSPPIAETAARLRLAVVRTARRLRQDAYDAEGDGVLSPTLTAALATVSNFGPLTPSELADRERIKRPTATRIVDHLVELGLATRDPRPVGRARVPGHLHGRRAEPCSSACALARTPTWPSACAPSTPTRSRRSNAPRGSSSACSRTLRRRRLDAALRRSFSSLDVPNYRRYFVGQIVSVSRQLDADGRRDVADPRADRQRGRRRRHLGPSVPPGAALRRLGRRPRRPLAEALAC